MKMNNSNKQLTGSLYSGIILSYPKLNQSYKPVNDTETLIGIFRQTDMMLIGFGFTKYIYSCEEVMNTSRQHILYRDITK